MATPLVNPSPLGGQERVVFYTTLLADGTLFYYLTVVPDAFRKEYQSLVRAHLDALQQRFSANRIDYTVLDTSKPLDHALYRYLSSRARMMKVR